MNSASDPITLLPVPRKMRRLPGIAGSTLRSALDISIERPQGYRLSLTSEEIRLTFHDAAGEFYGRQTLIQLRRQFAKNIPCLEIEDWPDYTVRGVMLDISRDKVPTMETLYAMIDQFAEWKINHLQLYMEHTFAYVGHEDVWQAASPITPDEIRALDAYCKERFIELVPNQNSFGHMERWLKHPRYLPLAEAPDGAKTPWGFRWKGPFSLCPTDPRCIELLVDLYDQLLPNFTSRLFNVGCDETFDIGQGRSRAECESRGVHQVYLAFLEKVHALVSQHGRHMMFWGDIILKEPSLIHQIPRHCIALDWGYEANHSFDHDAHAFARHGIAFYICPGTSSWCSIAGRTDNMLANQKNAARAGLKHGAIGFLNTDWGDYGHLQYLPVSYAGYAAGAAMSWCPDSNENLSLPDVLDLHVFQDQSRIMGMLACDIGNVYQSIGKLMANRSALFSILVPASERKDPMLEITRAGIETAESAIDASIANLSNARMPGHQSDLIRKEFQNAAAMLKHACHKARWKLDPKTESSESLINDLTCIIDSHRRCWLARNRPGGLQDSIQFLADNFQEYQKSPAPRGSTISSSSTKADGQAKEPSSEA